MPLRVALSTYRASYEIRNRLQLHVSFIVATLVAMKDVAEVESARATAASPNRKAPIPKQIRYIIGNEGCEPFSFYGMRNTHSASSPALVHC
jgi:hypothetical protein